MKTMNLKKSLSIHKITRTKCKRNTYRTDELNEKKGGDQKAKKTYTNEKMYPHRSFYISMDKWHNCITNEKRNTYE
jgi:hypothetical protein